MASQDLTEATRAATLRLYADYTGGNLPAVFDAMAEDIAWCSLGEGCAAWSGRFTGKQGVGDYFAALQASFAVTGYDIERVIADGEWATVVATVRLRFHGEAEEHAYAKADILHFAGGKLAEFREFYDTRTVVADLGRVNTASSDRATP